MVDCIFCQIAQKKIPAEIVYEDKKIIAFNDVNPKAPVHILIIPKKHIKDFISSGKFFPKILKVAKDLIKKYNLDRNGYRLVVNGRSAALVDHLHLHLLGKITVDRNV